jgi:alpha-amylase/alpha-mannosidase (GH57 family)
MTVDFLGVAPFAILSAAAAWVGQLWLYRERREDKRNEQHERLEIHRDELAFELLKNARQEMSSARVEVEDLRDEVRKLRAMEQHFYHFQQALDHLEALLFPPSLVERESAERAARAFLNRMKRLNEAKGTIANEVQRATAKNNFDGRKIDDIEKGMGNAD